MSMTNSNDAIWNRTHVLPTCSAVPQSTAPLHTNSIQRTQKVLLPSFKISVLGFVQSWFVVIQDPKWRYWCRSFEIYAWNLGITMSYCPYVLSNLALPVCRTCDHEITFSQPHSLTASWMAFIWITVIDTISLCTTNQIIINYVSCFSDLLFVPHKSPRPQLSVGNFAGSLKFTMLLPLWADNYMKLK
jgi:hypothetical protein